MLCDAEAPDRKNPAQTRIDLQHRIAFEPGGYRIAGGSVRSLPLDRETMDALDYVHHVQRRYDG
jgi:hypothetical protein